MKPEEFIAAIAPMAKACMAKSGIPASFTIAQGAIESGWGTAKTTVNAHNLFNIKADSSWHGPTWQMASEEVIAGKTVVQPAKWRLYPDWQACIDDRPLFLRTNRRYANCFSAKTPEEWAHAIAAAGWATDPNYADKIIATMCARNLQQFDKL